MQQWILMTRNIINFTDPVLLFPLHTGTGLDSWDTASVITLSKTFLGAVEMNGDLGSWIVAKVTTLYSMFSGASKFEGTGLASWVITKVTTFQNINRPESPTFHDATSLTSCNKREIADAWKGNTAFAATTYVTDWAADTCMVRFE